MPEYGPDRDYLLRVVWFMGWVLCKHSLQHTLMLTENTLRMVLIDLEKHAQLTESLLSFSAAPTYVISKGLQLKSGWGQALI